MYMRNIIYKILTGCYIVAALLLVGACNDNVDIQQFTRSVLKRCLYRRN